MPLVTDEQHRLRFQCLPRSSTGCWLWNGPIHPRGYGRVSYKNQKRAAHRLAYELFLGPVSDGLQLDHTCHTLDETCRAGTRCPHRRCVNPFHLEPVTPTENRNRGRGTKAQVTACPAGHPYDAVNTYARRYRGHSVRECRICKRRQQREYNARRKAAHLATKERT